MSGSLALVHGLEKLDRHSFQDGLKFSVETAFAPDTHYTLFRYEDWPAWVTFTIVFLVLIIFDNSVMNRNMKAMTVSRAILYTFFWMGTAVLFLRMGVPLLWSGQGFHVDEWLHVGMDVVF